VQAYTPEWAEKETGIATAEIVALAREMSKDKPSVIFHFGYRGAHHANENLPAPVHPDPERPHGQYRSQGRDLFQEGSRRGRRQAGPQADRTEISGHQGSACRQGRHQGFPLPDPDHGVPQMLPQAILNEDPYPIKALFVYRFEPLMSIPDTNLTKKALEKLDLIVTCDINYSDIAWYSDVILPESIYWSAPTASSRPTARSRRCSCGARPFRPATTPATGPSSPSSSGAHRHRRVLPLQGQRGPRTLAAGGHGLHPRGFRQIRLRGIHRQADPVDRKDGLKFKTPSKKIELKSSLLENAGSPRSRRTRRSRAARTTGSG